MRLKKEKEEIYQKLKGNIPIDAEEILGFISPYLKCIRNRPFS